MKPRHAATLALVGWYLMMPPMLGGNPPIYETPRPDLGAPLERWTVADTFDTASQCIAALASVREVPKNLDARTLTAEQLAQMQKSKKGLWASSDQCVVSDDPRLKGKKLTIVSPPK
ncbi:MAG TPA: hypothetical protein VN742_00920 [Candidatus Binataceae bacterium]|nr:hypothetical protein [Candidatus Binataceae bacterium]